MEMVYLQSSPNYCERDISLGSLGTVGRFCNRTARGKMLSKKKSKKTNIKNNSCPRNRWLRFIVLWKRL